MVSPAPPPPAAVPPPAAIAVRTVPESRGRGDGERIVTRLDAIGEDGVRRRVATLRNGGLSGAAVLSPDGRRAALARGDGRIAVVALGDGRTTTLSPPGLPRLLAPGATDASDLARLRIQADARVEWTADGRTVIVHGLLARYPDRWATELAETRTVACDVPGRRCSTAGRNAPADLVPLGGGRTLRIDGPTASGHGGGDGDATLGLTRRLQRTVLAALRRPVVSRVSVVRAPDGAGPRHELAVRRGSAGRGVVALGPVPVSGAAGTLIPREAVRIGRETAEDVALGDGTPSVRLSTRTLRPWIVTPSGRLRTVPRRVTAAPVGTLADGRWILPTADRGPAAASPPEPGLATSDGRGRVVPLRVAGRSLTPVGIALAAGLPDDFAAGAGVARAWERRGELFVALEDYGTGNVSFFPADGALVRIPLDGSGPARTVDRGSGAEYDVR